MTPHLQALLLADRVYKDVSGKHIIAGTFNRFSFQRQVGAAKKTTVDGEERVIVPAGMQAGSPTAYISLTNVHGANSFKLRYTSLKDDKVLLECGFTLESEDPLATYEIALPMPAIPLNEGIHALELLCNDEPIGSHRIAVEGLTEENHDAPS